MMWWNGAGWLGWMAMLLSMVIFWGGLLFLIAWGIKQFSQGSGRPDPKTILEERFARGEITKEELEEGRRALGGR
ncbi:MAG: SHOCT domain-containing protein [Actinobacteria bacterium]|nr:SHOCT domain-containing protein [Actinomycetota bacterium]